MFNKLREFIEKFYPTEPIRITFSKIRILFVITIVGFVVGIFYLRSQNKNELELLKQKHLEVKSAVQHYLQNMSQANSDETALTELRSKLNLYTKQLTEIENKIDDIKEFWFLE